MRGIGGTMIAFDVADAIAARRFLDRVQLFTFSGSLGYVDSLVQYPAATTHGMLSPEQRRSMGIGDGLLRLSVGIEASEDLLGDLEQALD